MADSKLSALTATTAISGTDELYANKGSNSRRITVANFLANLTDPIITTGALTANSITSLGDILGGGDLSLAAFFQVSTTDGIAAAGATQVAATALTSQANRVTSITATTDDGVALPTAAAGRQILIINAHATDSLAIWPASGDAIDGGSIDAEDANPLTAGSIRRYVAFDATNWYTV